MKTLRHASSILFTLVLLLTLALGIREAHASSAVISKASSSSLALCPGVGSPGRWQGTCGAKCNSNCISQGYPDGGSCEFNADVGANCCFCLL